MEFVNSDGYSPAVANVKAWRAHPVRILQGLPTEWFQLSLGELTPGQSVQFIQFPQLLRLLPLSLCL